MRPRKQTLDAGGTWGAVVILVVAAVRLFPGVGEMPDQVSAVYPLPSQEKGQADASGHYRVGSCHPADLQLLVSSISPGGLPSVNLSLRASQTGCLHVSPCVNVTQWVKLIFVAIEGENAVFPAFLHFSGCGGTGRRAWLRAMSQQ